MAKKNKKGKKYIPYPYKKAKKIRKAMGRPVNIRNRPWNTGNRTQAASAIQRIVRNRQARQVRLYRPIAFPNAYGIRNRPVTRGSIGRFGSRPNGMPFQPTYAQISRNRAATNLINNPNRNPRANRVERNPNRRNVPLRHFPQQVNAMGRPIRRNDPRYVAPQYPTAVARAMANRIRGSGMDELRR